MLLCVLMLGVGGFFVAINVVPPSTPEPIPVPTSESAEASPTPAQTSPLPTPIVKYDLSVRVNPPGGGTVSPGGGTRDAGTSVTLTARAAPDYQFSNWSGDVSGTSPTITVSMDSNKSVIANFAVIRYSLSTSVSPPGSGSVSPGSGTFDSGTSVTLTAAPSLGYRFSHWSGDASGTTSPITITMDRDKNVVANFEKIRYTLSASISPSGSGSVSPDSGTYDAGVNVSLTATPASGYRFSHWSGDASGNQNPITITMDRDKNVVANCYKEPPQEIIKKSVTSWSGGFILARELKAGDIVEVSVNVDRAPYVVLSSTWGYRILGPGGKPILSKEFDVTQVKYDDYNFTADQSGTYSIKVYHYDAMGYWDFTVRIWPPGWK